MSKPDHQTLATLADEDVITSELRNVVHQCISSNNQLKQVHNMTDSTCGNGKSTKEEAVVSVIESKETN
jgi:hypothetical protein